jgi:hypothetical protein
LTPHSFDLSELASIDDYPTDILSVESVHPLAQTPDGVLFCCHFAGGPEQVYEIPKVLIADFFEATYEGDDPEIDSEGIERRVMGYVDRVVKAAWN